MSRRARDVISPAVVEDGPPNRMTGREPLYGALVCGLIVAVGALDLVVTTGPGAPAHPNMIVPALGIVIAIGTFVSLRWRNRLLSPFAAIVAAFLVTYTRVPTSLTIPHLLVLVTTVAWAFVVTGRMRRADRAARGGSPAGRGRSAKSAEQDEPETRRPPANRRYTPPKAKPTDTRSRRR